MTGFIPHKLNNRVWYNAKGIDIARTFLCEKFMTFYDRENKLNLILFKLLFKMWTIFFLPTIEEKKN